MRCPECSALNESGTVACVNCGLLMVAAEPRRRAEDLAVQRRRATDNEVACRYCAGMVADGAIRCRHCGEVLDEEFYRARAQRIRSRINYASWVLYLFGLAALLVYRPVGMVSIACGLLLSIAYYAVQVEPPPAPGAKKRGLGAILAQQLRFERVSIAVPVMRQHKLVFVGTPLLAAVIGYLANVVLLQQPVDDILKQNAAFSGMHVSAHYQYWVVPGVVVYDLRSLSVRQTPIDVHTAFLEFAKQLKEKRYSRVDLSWRGDRKFSIDGASFARLGEEYSKRNFDYVLYSFPRLFAPAEGIAPLDRDTSDRDALMELHRKWYGEGAVVRNAEH